MAFKRVTGMWKIGTRKRWRKRTAQVEREADAASIARMARQRYGDEQSLLTPSLAVWVRNDMLGLIDCSRNCHGAHSQQLQFMHRYQSPPTTHFRPRSLIQDSLSQGIHKFRILLVRKIKPLLVLQLTIVRPRPDSRLLSIQPLAIPPYET